MGGQVVPVASRAPMKASVQLQGGAPVLPKLRNPYLEVFLKYMRPGGLFGWELRTAWRYEDGYTGPKWERNIVDSMNVSQARRWLVKYMAWAVPDDTAIWAIAELNMPVVELGAGLGYWAWMLDQAGVKITAYDKQPYSANFWKETDAWFPVQYGTQAMLKESRWKDHALLLCWPPYWNKMSSTALDNFVGDTLIYVGEGDGGCTGSPQFHIKLEKNWRLERTVDIPTWDGIHDALFIYRRGELGAGLGSSSG